MVITAEIRQTTEKAFGLFQGATHDVVDERTGEVTERPHFHWVAKKMATIKREWRGPRGERIAEIDLPDWLAQKAGLI